MSWGGSLCEPAVFPNSGDRSAARRRWCRSRGDRCRPASDAIGRGSCRRAGVLHRHRRCSCPAGMTDKRRILIIPLALVVASCDRADQAPTDLEQTDQEAALAVCGGPTGATCPIGQYCSAVKDVCPGPTAPGVCAVKPRFCPFVFLPVCGCDGKTYP